MYVLEATTETVPLISTQNVFDIYSLFLIMIGAVCCFMAYRMKYHKEVPKMLLNRTEVNQIKKPKKFCRLMAPKTFIMGIFCVCFGLFDRYLTTVLDSPMVSLGILTVFVIVMLWYGSALKKTKYECM